MSVTQNVLAAVLALACAGLTVTVVMLSQRVGQLEEAVTDLGYDLDEVAQSSRTGKSKSKAKGKRGRAVARGASLGGGGVKGPIAKLPQPVGAGAASDLDDEQIDEVVERVRSAQEAETAERDEKRAAFREARIQEMIDGRVTEVGDALGLDEGAREQLGTLLTEGMDKRRAVRDQIQSGELEFAEAREQMRGLREQSDAKLKELLGEDGFEAFQETRRGGPGGGRGRGPF